LIPVGYEALIGLLKWATPINPEKTLSTLMNVLYDKVCLKMVPTLQTPEYINFRSRQPFNTFPFDSTTFRASSKAQSKKDVSIPSVSSSQTVLLPVNSIRKLKYVSHHLYEVEFPTAYMLTTIRLYVGQPQCADMVHYKLIIKIYGGEKDEKLLYFNSFEEQVFNQVVQVIKTGSQSNPSGSHQ